MRRAGGQTMASVPGHVEWRDERLVGPSLGGMRWYVCGLTSRVCSITGAPMLDDGATR